MGAASFELNCVNSNGPSNNMIFCSGRRKKKANEFAFVMGALNKTAFVGTNILKQKLKLSEAKHSHISKNMMK